MDALFKNRCDLEHLLSVCSLSKPLRGRDTIYSTAPDDPGALFPPPAPPLKTDEPQSLNDDLREPKVQIEQRSVSQGEISPLPCSSVASRGMRRRSAPLLMRHDPLINR
jgi:hypothetical protein